MLQWKEEQKEGLQRKLIIDMENFICSRYK